MTFPSVNRLGSSPLTRGKLADQAMTLDGLGLIPAHAGKTYAISGLLPVVRAHPRSRGENSAPNLRLSFPAGSSPLTRGKRWRRRRSAGSRRLIPAHAGKTTSTTRIPSWAWAHPRSRGENAMTAFRAAHATGSSPLTRGKRCAPARHPRRRGLIPAHAGKTELLEAAARGRGLIPAHAGKTGAHVPRADE